MTGQSLPWANLKSFCTWSLQLCSYSQSAPLGNQHNTTSSLTDEAHPGIVVHYSTASSQLEHSSSSMKQGDRIDSKQRNHALLHPAQLATCQSIQVIYHAIQSFKHMHADPLMPMKRKRVCNHNITKVVAQNFQSMDGIERKPYIQVNYADQQAQG